MIYHDWKISSNSYQHTPVQTRLLTSNHVKTPETIAAYSRSFLRIQNDDAHLTRDEGVDETSHFHILLSTQTGNSAYWHLDSTLFRSHVLAMHWSPFTAYKAIWNKHVKLLMILLSPWSMTSICSVWDECSLARVPHLVSIIRSYLEVFVSSTCSYRFVKMFPLMTLLSIVLPRGAINQWGIYPAIREAKVLYFLYCILLIHTSVSQHLQ